MPDIVRALGLLVRNASSRRNWQRYGIAVILPCAAFLLTSQFTPITKAPLFPVFTLAVVLSTVFGGMNPGFVSVFLGVVINAWTSPPNESLMVKSQDDLIRILVFLGVSLVIVPFIGATGELQQRLVIERNRLWVTLQSIGDGVIATDTRGRVTMMNPVAEQVTGWTVSEARNRPLEDIFKIVNETTGATVENPVRRVLAEGRIVGLANHTILIRPDGTEIPIDDSAAPIRNEGLVMGVVLVFRDVSSERQSQVALMRAEKLASVGKLASTIAHEINNPLEAVSNLLFLLSQDSQLSPDSSQYVRTAQQELGRAAEMARNTLSFHKGETEWKDVSLRNLLDSVFSNYASRAASRGVQFENNLAPQLSVFGIEAQLRQLVSNLITNALDAMPHGGTMRVTGELIEVDGTPHVKIGFDDTGVGISPENLPRIFEPFFTTKADVGTGLGLWVVRRIVEDHDGVITVHSNGLETGHGTTFEISLPAANPHRTSEASA